MKVINLDQGWEYRQGFIDSLGGLSEPCTIVNLPHDSMISTKTSKDAPAKYDSGYFHGDMCNYTKYLMIPKEWENEKIGLSFDGVMMHTTISVNGSQAGEHHYGYSPFYVDITDFVAIGEENRITVNTNTGVQPSCRWYSGSGIYRSVSLCHGPRVHIKQDGVYIYTKEVTDDTAYMEAEIDVCNDTMENRLVEVTIDISFAGNELDKSSMKSEDSVLSVKRIVQVNSSKEQTAKMAFSIEKPLLWDIKTPNLYKTVVKVKDIGTYRTHLIKNSNPSIDESTALFGIRTITADSKRGLRINGNTVKLKGGCIHHDNGLLGAVSLYECEARKVMKLKETGFNAIRTAHNPPSAALVEACDRLGMYIFDEAYDAWGMAKRPGDFSTYFESRWEEEITAFVKRDRIHPSVIMWSTGNEIPERGGLSNGYAISSKLSDKVKSLDKSRPVSNGICSFWSGLDDTLAKGQDATQNAQNNDAILSWDTLVEPFTNGLDIVGYNYMEDLYENSHKLYPDRVILGSENFPKEIGFRWPVVEKLPYVIGDFTWTAWDYLGEAGIGKSVFVEPDDPLVEKGPWAVMPPTTSPYPWRLANDADYDITGLLRPQGAYRNVVWGSSNTYVYAQHPKYFGKTEVISMWGFTDVLKCWNFAGYEDKPVEVVAFTNADEAALYINGKMIEKKLVSKDKPLPNSVRFQTVYSAGKVEVISYKNGSEISKDEIETSKKPAGLIIEADKGSLESNGHDVAYLSLRVVDEDYRLVTDVPVSLEVFLEGVAKLAAVGTGNPVTEEIYTDNKTVTHNGYAMIILRSGYETGKAVVSVRSTDLDFNQSIEIEII